MVAPLVSTLPPTHPPDWPLVGGGVLSDAASRVLCVSMADRAPFTGVGRPRLLAGRWAVIMTAQGTLLTLCSDGSGKNEEP